MQQIRQQIIAKRAAVGPGAAGSGDLVVTGKRFSPEFYEHLYQARLALDDYQVPVFVSKSGVATLPRDWFPLVKSGVPIIGALLVWLRTKFHELVTYYVNQSAARQVSATHHLLQALSVMGQELEDAAGDAR